MLSHKNVEIIHFNKHLFSLSVGTLLPVLGFLLGRATTMGTCDISLFLGFGLHLALVGVLALAASPEIDTTAGDDVVNVAHGLEGISGGTGARQ